MSRLTSAEPFIPIMSKKTFRILLVTGWALTLLTHALRAFEQSLIPAEVATAISASNPPNHVLYMWALFFFGYLYLIIFIVSTVGLFLFKNWARGLYVLFFVLGFVYALLPAFIVYARLQVLIGGMYSLISTLVLAVIFFSPLKDQFKRMSESKFN